MMDISFPPPDLDPIIRLHDYYFQNADLMFENTEKLFALNKRNGRLSRNNAIKIKIYAQLWFATLRVVVEGFQDDQVKKYFEKIKQDLHSQGDLEVNVCWGSIQHMIGQLDDELKWYRNATFHFQNTMSSLDKKRFSFLKYEGRHDPLEWARDLHQEMRRFFDGYRSRAAAEHMHQQLLATGAKPGRLSP